MNIEHKYAERISSAENAANQGCGLSDVLYERRVQAAYAEILRSAHESERTELKGVLLARGYDPAFDAERESNTRDDGDYGPHECGLTGISADCCPCGNHP